jgi:hypothetical protein
MGLVETIAEHASVKSVVLFLIGAWLLQFVVNRIIEHIRIKRLGNYGKGLPYYLPFGKSCMPFPFLCIASVRSSLTSSTGIDMVIAAVKATVAAKNLEIWRDVYFEEKDRWTAEGRVFNQRIVFTADTENIKAILATQFTDFGKGEPFHAEWSDFLGDSIFTTDGNKWHASRQLIRPQFTRDRVSDLHCFEDHMKTLFRAIDNGGALDSPDQFVKEGSGSGKVIDFSEILFRFTLDVATDFLLGKDTQSLTYDFLILCFILCIRCDSPCTCR